MLSETNNDNKMEGGGFICNVFIDFKLIRYKDIL